MKICPNCQKGYDNSWGACTKCGVKLSKIDEEDFFSLKFEKLAKYIGTEFKKIESRINKIEKSLGIEPEIFEKTQVSESQKVEKLQDIAAKPKEQVKEINKKDIETTIGTLWLNRIGIFALLLGAAFFLKYTFDNRWIGELGRVVLGLVAGFSMILGSELTRKKKYDIMSQGFHGGGVAILYLSIFVAFGFYHLIGLFPAFLFMSIVTLYCGFWSAHINWVSSAVIGIAGGFLTPFLLGTQNITPSLLFTYVLLLDLGVLYISIYKKWIVLNIGSFFLTHLIFYNWYTTTYRNENWVLALVFISIFFLTFCFLSIFHNLIYKERSDKTDVVLVLFNGLVYFGELFGILKPFSGHLPGLLPLTLGCIYIGYSYSALTRCKEDKELIHSYVGLAVLFVTVAIPVQLKYNWVAISWALEALLLVWVGFKLNYLEVRKAGLFIGIIGIFKVLLFDYSYEPYDYSKYTFIFNERLFTYLIIVSTIFVAAWLYKQNKDKITANEKVISTVLVLLANFMLLVQLSVESRTYFAHIAYVKTSSLVGADKSSLWKQFISSYSKLFSARELSMSLLWVIYALVMIGVGINRKFRALRIMALVLFGIAVLKIFLIDLSQLEKGYRIISFISLGLVLLIASFFYQRYKDEILNFALKD